MAKLLVTLKQHTPLIHFEHNVEGATLRATELKPKLDKFLIENLFLNDKEQYKDLLINGQEKAFDYKVKIKEGIKIPNLKLKIEDFKGLYFGNMGDEKKKGLSFYENIEVEFFSFKNEIIEKIKEVLPKFLFFTNFGTRQSKGFGSFSINNKLEYKLNGKDEIYTKNEIDFVKSDIYNFTVKCKTVKEVFNKLEIFYRSLRSGLNYNKVKPFIELYCEEKYKKDWDKQSIKEKYFGEKKTGKNKLLIKDFFGLSTSEDWKMQKGLITKEDKNKEIQRFKSPLLFKIIKSKKNSYDVYIIINDSYKVIQGKTFIIKNHDNDKNKLELSFPLEFDFNDFFEWLLNMEDKKYNYAVRDILKGLKKVKENV